MTTSAHNWQPDRFLDRYEVLTIPLGQDPEGEDPIVATLVRKPGQPDGPRGAVLYVHGFTDYFFQERLAEFFHDRGFAFYALDLRKAGRSLAMHHQPHYTTDLARYDEELGRALDVIVDEERESGGAERVIVGGHSTGGLVTALWLDRIRREDPERHRRVAGLMLNSPWFDLQGEAVLRTGAVTKIIDTVGRLRPKTLVPRKLSSAYGDSLHDSKHGEWSYNLDCKPLEGFPVTFGWLSAVRAGHRALHSGLDVGVPALVLRSDKSAFRAEYHPVVDVADTVLDVQHIAQWAGNLGTHVLSVAIPDAKHDVFLSSEAARDRAYHEVDRWLNSQVAA